MLASVSRIFLGKRVRISRSQQSYLWSVLKTHGLVGSFGPLWHFRMLKEFPSGVEASNFGELKGGHLTLAKRRPLDKIELLMKLLGTTIEGAFKSVPWNLSLFYLSLSQNQTPPFITMKSGDLTSVVKTLLEHNQNGKSGPKLPTQSMSLERLLLR